MKKFCFVKTLLVFLVFSSSMFSQNYVNATCKLNSGRIISGLVKNDFKEDDESIFFKENNYQEVEFKIVDILEILIDNKEKFISKAVDYHPNHFLSNSELKQTNNDNFSDRENKHLLLKVLVEGESTLYKTVLNDKTIYYYSKSVDDKIIYLENFPFYASNKSILYNSMFKRQLLRNLNCKNELNDNYQNIFYEDKDLIQIFNEYNICYNGLSKIYEDVFSKDKIYRLYVYAGLKQINGAIVSESIFFKDNKIKGISFSPYIGFEFSHVLPTRKENSEIFTRFEFYKINLVSATEFTKIESGASEIYENFTFNSLILDFSLGFRYYLNSFNESKVSNLGFDCTINYLLPKNSNFLYETDGTMNRSYNLRDNLNNSVLGFGLGINYIYKNNYVFELRYNIDSGYLSDLAIVETRFQNISFGCKYLILQNTKKQL
jgi:hypothetical protein